MASGSKVNKSKIKSTTEAKKEFQNSLELGSQAWERHSNIFIPRSFKVGVVCIGFLKTTYHANNIY